MSGKLSPNATLSKTNRTNTVGAKKVIAGKIAFLITLCTKVASGVTLDGRKVKIGDGSQLGVGR